jgi:hypothetical protein
MLWIALPTLALAGLMFWAFAETAHESARLEKEPTTKATLEQRRAAVTVGGALALSWGWLGFWGVAWLFVYAACRTVAAIGREIRGAGKGATPPAVTEQQAPRPPPSGPGWWRE